MEKIFSYYCKSNKIIKKSSSGGAFYALSYYIINKLNGVVYGVSNKSNEVFHCRIDNINQIYLLMRSKYVKANLKATFSECENDLNNHKIVLYSGLPCEIFALKKYLEKNKVNTEHLITVDLICHGVPSNDVWQAYLSEKFNFQKISYVNFRYKKLGWEKYFIKIKTNKQTYVSFKRNDEYMRAFSEGYSLMPSCYQCIFKGNNHFSDLTLGDFWNVKKYTNVYNKKGTSLIILHNDGLNSILIPALDGYGIFKEMDLSILEKVNPSYYFSTNKPKDYQKYCEIAKKEGFLKAVNGVIKTENYSFKIKVLNKLKSFFNKK